MATLSRFAALFEESIIGGVEVTRCTIQRLHLSVQGVPEEYLLIAIADILAEEPENVELWNSFLTYHPTFNSGSWERVYWRLKDIVAKSLGEVSPDKALNSTRFAVNDTGYFIDLTGGLLPLQFDQEKMRQQFLPNNNKSAYLEKNIQEKLRNDLQRGYLALFLLKLFEALPHDKQPIAVHLLFSKETLKLVRQLLGTPNEFGRSIWIKPLCLPEHFKEAYPRASYIGPHLEDCSIVEQKFIVFGQSIHKTTALKGIMIRSLRNGGCSSSSSRTSTPCSSLSEQSCRSDLTTESRCQLVQERSKEFNRKRTPSALDNDIRAKERELASCLEEVRRAEIFLSKAIEKKKTAEVQLNELNAKKEADHYSSKIIQEICTAGVQNSLFSTGTETEIKAGILKNYYLYLTKRPAQLDRSIHGASKVATNEAIQNEEVNFRILERGITASPLFPPMTKRKARSDTFLSSAFAPIAKRPATKTTMKSLDGEQRFPGNQRLQFKIPVVASTFSNSARKVTSEELQQVCADLNLSDSEAGSHIISPDHDTLAINVVEGDTLGVASTFSNSARKVTSEDLQQVCADLNLSESEAESRVSSPDRDVLTIHVAEGDTLDLPVTKKHKDA